MEQKIIDFIANQLLNDNSGTIQPDINLFDNGTLNSLGMMRLIRHLERQFAITVPFEDMLPSNFSSVNSIVHYVESKRNNP